MLVKVNADTYVRHDAIRKIQIKLKQSPDSYMVSCFVDGEDCPHIMAYPLTQEAAKGYAYSFAELINRYEGESK